MTPDFEKGGGLLPAIIQDPDTGKVLMLGYLNAEALEATLKTGKVHFFSRSKNRLWMKGETSGDILELREIFLDCDADSFLILARQTGKATCHTGRESCFFYRKETNGHWVVDES